MSMWAVCVAGMAGGVLAVDGQPGKSLTFLVVFALMLGLTAAWFACSRREELAADRGAADVLAGLGYDPVAVAARTLLASGLSRPATAKERRGRARRSGGPAGECRQVSLRQVVQSASTGRRRRTTPARTTWRCRRGRCRIGWV